MHRILFFILFLGLGNFSFSQTQDFVCGTEVPKNAKQFESTIHLRPGSAAITNCLNKVLSVNVIIVADSLRNPGITIADIQAGLAGLNGDFAPICLSFQLCNVDTVFAYKYNRWERPLEHAEFETNYCQMGVINFALVTDIRVPAGASGYAPMAMGLGSNTNRDLIVIKKSAFGGKTLAHEVGHYFGLYHTFETSMGVEFVNGSNCATTGDILCDTPADINPAPIAPGCIWIGTNRDPNNDYYTPMLGNTMSYHQGCGRRFTIEQYNRMIFCYLNYRNYLY